ncbi:hypothetical protein CGC54_01025 [Capnocytophaga canimorsus]|uniref:Peptidase S49 domain-containing protein n=1 Tax=Capnocytophaga canimorsus TaxID=28188 RepID=A0AAC9Z214_9FLAO|nr:S49 family peptidase [Capnocytophaga canimorsus]ATA93033.1 hypothetical protein CGC54_01025 [Capnocytophaga canimorsus]
MNDLAQCYKVGHISIEEHPESRLYKEKAYQYEEYAPQSSEKNKLYRDLQSGDNTSAQEHLSVLADNFINTMKAYRPQIKDDEKVFKGAVYAPKKALEVGLIDEIMTLEQILNEF